MGTNGTYIASETNGRKRVLDEAEPVEDFALAPMVDKIAFGIAKGLVAAVKELEQHIAGETRKVGDKVERQIDGLQVSLQDLFRFVSEQRAANVAVQEQLQQLTTASASLRETDAKQAVELDAVRLDAKSVAERINSLCGDIGVQQEDIGAAKTTLGTLCSRVDALVERLDRQAEAVRLMHTNYSQRETELEQLVSGLARLRAFPAPLPVNGL